MYNFYTIHILNNLFFMNNIKYYYSSFHTRFFLDKTIIEIKSDARNYFEYKESRLIV